MSANDDWDAKIPAPPRPSGTVGMAAGRSEEAMSAREWLLDDLQTFISEAKMSEDGGMDDATWERIEKAINAYAASEVKRVVDLLCAKTKFLTEVISAHDIDSFDCDRRGVVHCDCLSNALKDLQDALAAARAELEKA